MKDKVQLLSKGDMEVFVGNVLALSFAKTVLLQFLHALYGAENSTISAVVFGFLFVYLYIGLVKYNLLKGRGLAVWFACLVFFLVNYVFTNPNLQQYYSSIDMVLTYIYYLPIAIILIPQIRDVKKVISRISLLRYPVLLIASYMVFAMSFASAEQETYMSFSYAIMPFVILCFYEARFNNKFIDYITYILGVVLIVFYGARTPLTSCLLAAVLIYVLYVYYHKKKSGKIFTYFLLGVLAVVFIYAGSSLIGRLGGIGESIGSYSLEKLNDDSFMESSTRVFIYDSAIKLMENNNGMPLGFFADRYYLDVIYVHNIFLELLINFGVIVGGFLSLWIVYLIVRSFIVSKDEYIRLFLIFCFLSIFVRFILSGSYLIEGMSFVYFSVLLKYSHKHVVRSNIAHIQKRPP